MAYQYGIAIIKPDSVRDGLESKIIQDLADAGLEIVWTKYWQIQPAMVPLIYPKEVGKPTYSSTVKAIAFGPSVVVLVKEPSHVDIWTHLKKVKGKMNTDGIRHKYCDKTKAQLVLMGYEGERLQDKLAENRLHTADSLEEVSIILSLCLLKSERRQLEMIAPDLWSKLSIRSSK